MHDRQVIVCAGVGDLGKYTCEELLASTQFDVVVLSRRKEHPWCDQRGISVHSTDYTQSSLTSIFSLTRATTVISFINQIGADYIKTHTNLLAACQKSDSCKRLIPSEWIGDSETFPNLPRYYADSRGPVRQMLASQKDVEWTFFNVGWLADYLLPESKTYLKPIPGKFPIDQGWRSALIRGTGDEPQSWVSAREAGKAVVELCKASSWVEILLEVLREESLTYTLQETHTYVAGDWKTFNEVIELIQELTGRTMTCAHVSKADIEASLAEHQNDEEPSDAGELAQVEEMMIAGSLSCPKEKTLRQRKDYFSNIKFSSLNDLLKRTELVNFM